MKKTLKPTPLQIAAAILLAFSDLVVLIAPLFDQTFANNGISWELSSFIKRATNELLFLPGLLIIALLAKEKPVRVAMICGLVIELIGIILSYDVCTRITEAGEYSLGIYNLDVSRNIISCFIWVWILSVIIRDKKLTDVGWIQILPIILTVNMSVSIFFLVLSNYALPGSDTLMQFMFTDNFVYKLWFTFGTPVLHMIGYYYLATSELFNNKYSNENATSGWKAYSPFNKWMAAAFIVPVVIFSLTLLVYNL